MRLPTRKSQSLKIPHDEGPLYLTQGGIEKLERRLKKIESLELPEAIEDVRRTGEFGDFSENAEYQEAKWRMRRLHNSVLTIKDKLKRAVLIETDKGVGGVQIGSTVVLQTTQGDRKTFEIVGPSETDPTRGRLSYRSPLGASLMGREVGESVEAALIHYTIVDIT
ncbi:MAG: GreA/GreB family elongation factor [Parcubacteria group bacterium]|nr:GreA/GreB family elongation factor [Parcubacteria group bacterium]